MRYREPRASGLAVIGLTGVRLAIGVWWILQYRWKPPPAFGCPGDGFCRWLSRELQYPAVGPYADLLRLVVLPHSIVFAWLVFVVETVVGASLILGLYTRLGAFVGTVWSLTVLVGLLGVPDVTTWAYLAIVLLNVLFFSIGAMSQLAVDRIRYTRSWWAGSG